MMNLVDLLALVPFYVTVMMNSMDDIVVVGKAGKMIRLIRVLRVMRIFKLVRHFAGLQSLISTMKEAYKELGLLLMLVCVTTFLFSIIVYSNEKHNEEPWTLLDAILWAIGTISTVGTDGSQPTSFFGQILGGICPVFSVFVLCLPIPIIVNSFGTCYRNRVWRMEVQQKKDINLKERRESNTKHLQHTYIRNAPHRKSKITGTLIGDDLSYVRLKYKERY